VYGHFKFTDVYYERCFHFTGDGIIFQAVTTPSKGN